MAEYLLAHDLGTSGDKATLFTVSGQTVKSAVCSYPTNYFNQGWAEQNPEDWWHAVCQTTSELLEGIDPGEILSMSFSAQMQCCLPVDKQGTPLHPAIIWADQRAAQETAEIVERVGFDRIYEITGHRPNPSYTLEKLMWLRRHKPEVYEKMHYTLHVKDYILFKLTGNFVTDYSDASGMNLLDLDKREWSAEILEQSGIRQDVLPQLRESTDVVGHVTAEAAAATGLRQGMPVVCGGGDGPCSAVGAGCIHDGQLFSSFGTSAWIAGTSREKFIDEEKACMCFGHVIPGRYMPCGTMQAAGSSYSFIKKLLAENTPYSELDQMIASAPVGSNGLIFLPYLVGERSPRWDPDATGAFLGMRMQQTKPDYLRAVIEGVGMNLAVILRTFRKQMQADNLILTGGGARGQAVCQALADIWNASLKLPDDPENATSVAAAIIAGVGVGAYQDFGAVERFIHYDRSYQPNADAAAKYQQLLPVFDQSYSILKPFYQMTK